MLGLDVGSALATAGRIEEAGGAAISNGADVGDSGDVSVAAGRLVDACGRLGDLCNNAGIQYYRLTTGY